HRLEHVAALQAKRSTLKNCGFVSERAVVGMSSRSTDGKLVQEFTDDAVPLLISGFLETACDTRGCIGWRVTNAGLEALKLGKPEPDDLSEYDGSLADEYLALRDDALRERENWNDGGQVV